MQSLEYTEDLIGILHVKPDPVVPDKIYRSAVLFNKSNLHFGVFPYTGKLNGIGKEVGKHLP